MTTTAQHQAARKGDLIVVENVSHDYVIGQSRTERVSFEFGVVHSATRDGDVKTFRAVGWGDSLLSEHAEMLRSRRCRVVPAGSVTSVDDVIRAAKAHHWPNHPGQPMPFDSLDEAREIVRPFLADNH